jgi:DNA-binding transcriptional ArsR family regulator
MILYQLSSGLCNVNELVNSLKMQQPMVSRYLKVLRERGMVRVERQGAEVIYGVSDVRLIQALDML